eukprot:IDg18109t1
MSGGINTCTPLSRTTCTAITMVSSRIRNPTRVVLAAVLFIACLLAFHMLSRSRTHGVCGDFTFAIALAPHMASRWNASLKALNPNKPYGDHVVLTYHNDPQRMRVNNAQCQLQLLGTNGMTRTQLQNTKPRILIEAIRRSRAAHLAY